MSFLFVLLGLVLLLVGGDFLVRGAVALAVKFHISPLVIGLTVVAFGTSAPELFVAFEAVQEQHFGLALGNVVGSNIANILLVLGLPAMIYPTLCNQPSVLRNCMLMIGATLLFIAICLTGEVTRFHGIVMVGLLCLFLLYSARRARKSKAAAAEALEEMEEFTGLPDKANMIALYLAGGLIGLPLGANLLIGGAVDIATSLGVSEAVIGLTLVAVGTSLPELATTVVAAMRRHSEVAIGNALGSNLFNILAVIGITAIVFPIKVPDSLLGLDMLIMLACALIILPYSYFHRPIGRLSGFVFVMVYSGYMYYLFQAGEAAAAVGN